MKLSERVTCCDGLVVGLHIGDRIGKFNHVGWSGNGSLETCKDCCRTILTLLGRHEDDAVRTTGTVKCSCSRIFHYRETLNIIRSKSRKVGRSKLNVIDEDERVGVCTECGDTAHEEVGIVLTRFTGTLVGNHTGNVTRKSGSKVAGRHLEGLHVNGCDGTDHAFLLLLTECNDNCIIQFRSSALELDLESCGLPYGNDFRLISEVLELEFVGRLYAGKFEITVKVGDCTFACIDVQYGRCRQAFSRIRIDNDTPDRLCLLGKNVQRKCHQRQNSNNS